MAHTEKRFSPLARQIRVSRPMNSRVIERYYPRVGALIVGGAWSALGAPVPNDSLIGVALISSMTMAAIIMGFASTSVSVLLGLDSPIMDRIRKSGAVVALGAYISECIFAALLLALTAFVGFFTGPSLPFIVGFIWITSLALLGLSFIRLSRIMVGLLISKKSR